MYIRKVSEFLCFGAVHENNKQAFFALYLEGSANKFARCVVPKVLYGRDRR